MVMPMAAKNAGGTPHHWDGPKAAEALEVSLDYLVGNTDMLLEKSVINKIVDIQKQGTEDKAHVFALLDAFLQSHKAKKVFAS